MLCIAPKKKKSQTNKHLEISTGNPQSEEVRSVPNDIFCIKFLICADCNVRIEKSKYKMHVKQVHQ
jgi:hypothetical protein